MPRRLQSVPGFGRCLSRASARGPWWCRPEARATGSLVIGHENDVALGNVVVRQAWLVRQRLPGSRDVAAAKSPSRSARAAAATSTPTTTTARNRGAPECVPPGRAMGTDSSRAPPVPSVGSAPDRLPRRVGLDSSHSHLDGQGRGSMSRVYESGDRVSENEMRQPAGPAGRRRLRPRAGPRRCRDHARRIRKLCLPALPGRERTHLPGARSVRRPAALRVPSSADYGQRHRPRARPSWPSTRRIPTSSGTTHVALMTRSPPLNEDDLVAVSSDLGLSRETPEEAQQAARHARERVESDERSARSSGVRYTPTFFINGRRYDGPWDEVLSPMRCWAHSVTGFVRPRSTSRPWAPSAGLLLLLASVVAVFVTNSMWGPAFRGVLGTAVGTDVR